MSTPKIETTEAGHSFTFKGKVYGPYSTRKTAEHMRKVITKPRSMETREAASERARMRRG